MFKEFKHENGAYYAFVEVPIEFLDTVVPDVKWSKIVELDGAVRQRTLKEFLVHYIVSIDGASAVMQLGAKEQDDMRNIGVSEQDMSDWLHWLSYFKIDWSRVMNRFKHQALLETDRYFGG